MINVPELITDLTLLQFEIADTKFGFYSAYLKSIDLKIFIYQTKLSVALCYRNNESYDITSNAEVLNKVVKLLEENNED